MGLRPMRGHVMCLKMLLCSKGLWWGGNLRTLATPPQYRQKETSNPHQPITFALQGTNVIGENKRGWSQVAAPHSFPPKALDAPFVSFSCVRLYCL